MTNLDILQPKADHHPLRTIALIAGTAVITLLVTKPEIVSDALDKAVQSLDDFPPRRG